MTEQAADTTITGITPEELTRLQAGGWEDSIYLGPRWKRRVEGDEQSRGETQYIEPSLRVDDWLASFSEDGEDDDDECNFGYVVTANIDEAMRHSERSPSRQVKPAAGPCTHQTEAFAHRTERWPEVRSPFPRR